MFRLAANFEGFGCGVLSFTLQAISGRMLFRDVIDTLAVAEELLGAVHVFYDFSGKGAAVADDGSLGDWAFGVVEFVDKHIVLPRFWFGLMNLRFYIDGAFWCINIEYFNLVFLVHFFAIVPE